MANVTVYTTSICPYCVRLKQFLSENGIEFKEIDVSTDTEAGREMAEKSGQLGVPVTDIDGSIVVGYNVPKLKEALKIE